MGAVYRAHDPALDRTVAIKVILSASEEYLLRFARESRAIARLSHPHIVQVYDSGADERGNPYFVMELIEGKSLSTLLGERGPLPVAQVVELLRQAAQGLAAAHAAGIVHRDIKPANLIYSDKHGIKLVDFGIARLASATEDLTATHATLGTLSYMAPEVLNGQPADARADIYALGLCTFHLLTGRPPFAGPSAVAVAMKQISEPLPDLRREVPGAPPELYQLIERMTHKSRERRVQTCDEVAAAAAAIAGQLTNPSTDASPHTTRQVPRLTAQLPVVLLAGGLGLLASVVLAIVLSGKARDHAARHAAGPSPVAPVAVPAVPAESAAAPAPPTRAAAATGPVRVAVLKFKNLGGDRDLDFYSEGLAEQAIIALAPLQGLGNASGRPPSRRIMLIERNQFDEQNLPELKRSQTDYIDKATAAQLGKVLGAEVVVQGAFQRVETQVKVTARFTNLATATILDTVNVIAPIGSARDKFAVQDLVADKIKEKMQALLPRLRG
jgi:serine/threonine-protein kinase